MAYPNIFPVEPGRDGWQQNFNSSVSRLLYHCGMMPTGLKVAPGRPATPTWTITRQVPAFVRSEETRPLTVSLTTLKKVLLRVHGRFGAEEVRDLLKVHGNATAVERVKVRDYRNVYIAAFASLDRVS